MMNFVDFFVFVQMFVLVKVSVTYGFVCIFLLFERFNLKKSKTYVFIHAFVGEMCKPTFVTKLKLEWKMFTGEVQKICMALFAF